MSALGLHYLYNVEMEMAVESVSPGGDEGSEEAGRDFRRDSREKRRKTAENTQNAFCVVITDEEAFCRSPFFALGSVVSSIKVFHFLPAWPEALSLRGKKIRRFDL